MRKRNIHGQHQIEDVESTGNLHHFEFQIK